MYAVILKITWINIINLLHTHILSRSLSSLFARLKHMVDVKSDFDNKERGKEEISMLRTR